MNDNVRHDSPAGAVGLSGGQFVRNCWYVAAWSAKLAPGELVARTILNQPIVLFRREDKSVAAIPDTCPHRFAPLSMGKLLPGDRVQCPYHGLEFAADGRCVHNPHGNGTIPAALHLRGIPAVERHTAIWVWLGDKPATPETIPDFACLDTTPALFVTDPGYLLMRAGYELIVDNLLDLSHTSYLHDGILGNAETVDAEISVVQKGDIVSVSRPSANVTTPGLLRSLATWDSPRGDQIQTIDWFAPSCLSLKTGVVPTGRPADEGTGFYAIHLLTPETDKTTHYFFTAARFNVLTEGEANNAAIRANIAKMRLFAFAEQDAPVIEAQQRRIDQAGGALRPTLLAIDAGPVQYRRILARMLREDA
jgi:vanillate O-demethylase monooxygenase subunit